MQTWQTIWTVFCGVGLLSFAVLVAVIIPRGAVELKEFFATLDADRDTIHDK